MVRAPDRCTGSHGFHSHRGLNFFSLSHAHAKVNIACLLFLSELKIYHLSIFINTHGAFDIADRRSVQDVCHSEPRPRSPRASQ